MLAYNDVAFEKAFIGYEDIALLLEEFRGGFIMSQVLTTYGMQMGTIN